MRITISGPIGSGKSTVGKILAEELGYRYFSGGFFFREHAKKRGMSVEEFNLYAEHHTEIDHDQDDMIAEFLSKNDNIVVESRLAGWLSHLRNIRAFKVFITASFDTRLGRITRREGESGDLGALLKTREESERKRYLELYSIDYGNTDIYDLVINTDNLSASEVAEKIYEAAGFGKPQ